MTQQNPFKFATPLTISTKEMEYVQDAVKNGHIRGADDYGHDFELLLSDVIGRNYTVLTASPATGLETALAALMVKPGDEVIVPALAPPAVMEAVRSVRAVPIVVDVDMKSWTIDPAIIRESTNARTRALIAVDFLGHPADFDAIRDVMPRVPVIEYGEHSLGASYHGRLVGANGLISVLSFSSDQSVTAGEGGAILTDEIHLAERIRSLNIAPISGLAAAFGLGQMERASELIAQRNTANDRIKKLVKNIKFKPSQAWAETVSWLPVLTTIHKDSILKALRLDCQIDARSIWPPLSAEMNHANEIYDQAICLPACYDAAGCKEIARILSDAVREQTMLKA